ncbi:hypothetical protein NL108_016247 [Boleophthalmus pectinirostris]|nr:hypothetical protein NL108_016247 [Boleophthalmus pectinirostris]
MPVREMALSPVKCLSWSSLPPMSQRRVYCAALHLQGALYVLGGCGEGGSPSTPWRCWTPGGRAGRPCRPCPRRGRARRPWRRPAGTSWCSGAWTASRRRSPPWKFTTPTRASGNAAPAWGSPPWG